MKRVVAAEWEAKRLGRRIFGTDQEAGAVRVECFLSLIILAIILFLATGAGLGIGAQSSLQSFQRLRNRFGGTLQGGTLFRRPSLRFQYGESQATVTAGAKGEGAPSVSLCLEWPDASAHLSITTRAEDTLAQVGLATNEGLAEIRLGDPELDDRFRFFTDSPDDARRLLSVGVQWPLRQLHDTFANSALRIDILGGELFVKKQLRINCGEELERFVQLSLQLFSQALLTRCEGIEFLEDAEEAQVIEDPICPVCSEAIKSGMVFCRRCRAPHHRDCWEYFGGCSTYACGETECLHPAVGRRIDERSKRRGS